MKPLRHSLLALAIIASGLILWTGCDSTGGVSDSTEGRFVLKLTDNPANLDTAVVTIDRVDLVSEDADDSGDDGDDEENGEDEEGVITLTDQTRQIDLLTLQGGVDSTLADVTVPEGEYSQLRFVLSDSSGAHYVVTNEGEHQTLQVPSGMQTGIKIVLPGEVEIENEGDELAITLDFDVEDSFVQQGNGQYLFKPTVRVKNVSVNGESVETVAVEGAVTAVDVSGGSLDVEGISFGTNERTEFDGVSGLDALTEGDHVEVDGTVEDDGSRTAQEVEAEDDEIEERSITARLESKDETDGEESVSLLGATIQVTTDTEFDDGGLAALESGDRVEVDYVVTNDGAKVATEIERQED